MMQFFSSFPAFFAQGEGGQAGGREGNFMQTLIMIGIAIVFFYFILWRPERKRRKAMEKRRREMKKSDRVTVMGMIGTLAKIQDKTVMIQVDGAKIEVLKAAITDVQASGETTVETESTNQST